MKISPHRNNTIKNKNNKIKIHDKWGIMSTGSSVKCIAFLIWYHKLSSTYSSARLSGGTRVSWEADRTLQTNWDNEETEHDSGVWHHVNNSSGSRQLDWERWHTDDSSNNASVMVPSVRMCEWSWRTGLPLGPSSPAGPRPPAGPAAPGGPVSPFSPVSPLGPWGENRHGLVTWEPHGSYMPIAC